MCVFGESISGTIGEDSVSNVRGSRIVKGRNNINEVGRFVVDELMLPGSLYRRLEVFERILPYLDAERCNYSSPNATAPILASH